MVKQNDKKCLEVIQKIGCFFRSCGNIAEIKTGRNLTAKQINDCWKWAKNTKRINDDDDVVDSASIATRFLRVLGDDGKFVEVGTFKQGVTSFYPAYKFTELARIDALIQKISQNGPSKTHFRVVDNFGNVLEDPHEPAIKPTGIYYSILYAYIPGSSK